MQTLIITGGKINKKFLKKHLQLNKYDIIIAVDKGLESLDYLNIEPNYIIGDFDSIKEDILNKYNKDIFIKLNPKKDFTDTEAALELAIKIKSSNITIIGAIGTRIDHTIANIHILTHTLEKGIDTKILNEHNEIKLINNYIEIEKDKRYKYISIIPLTTDALGITLKGFKYFLDDYNLKIGTSLTVSNEQIEKKATIKIKKGILILIKSRD